jgi:hypothetical protein
MSLNMGHETAGDVDRAPLPAWAFYVLVLLVICAAGIFGGLAVEIMIQ